MLLAILAVQILVLAALVLLFLRARQPRPDPLAVDPRQAQLLDHVAQLPHQVAQLHARHEALDAGLRHGLDVTQRELRSSLAEHRAETRAEAATAREAADRAAQHLRAELAASATTLRTELASSLTTLGGTLASHLADFRTDHTRAADKLHADVHLQHDTVVTRLAAAAAEQRDQQLAARDALHTRLSALLESASTHQENLRGTVQERLDALNAANAAKLEEMRATVDEKLHTTLQSRLTDSFSLVSQQLKDVHSGLGEMSKLSAGVDGLSRIFTNVRSRGGFAEVQLGVLLRQMLAPGQFVENATIKPGSGERVEYAVRFPTAAGERLLPIDAKFPLDAWERLETAYEGNQPELIERESRNFESAIRAEADRICKYIHPPATTPYGIMFLPTEGIYAEVIRREALQADIQARCRVTIAGPTTLSAILTSFQMGFHMLALQEKGDEVWKVLERTRTEFRTFETLMGSMEKQVGTVQNTIQKLGVRTRAINRTLREVSTSDNAGQGVLEELSNVVPMLAADGSDG